jgi:putative peptide zinc metalloprotease protein
MSHNMTPMLRADVRILPFDGCEGESRFIVAVDERHFVVGAVVAAVLQESRASSTAATIAQRVSERLGCDVSVGLVSQVISEQRLSVCFQASEQQGALGAPTPASECHAPCPIRIRARVIGAGVLDRPLAVLSKLFAPRLALLVAALAVAVLIAVRPVAGSAGDGLSAAETICAVALTLLGVVVHELGHLAACARFGATHGGIGVGLYWCMPVFYAEVHGAWTLPRLQRAAVDAGGVYLQCIYAVMLGAAFAATDAPAFREAIAWTFFLMLHTLNPVLKYDGYWLLTDLAGVPDLHARIKGSAQRVWSVVRRTPGASFPATRALLLLGAFTAIAFVYFAYLLLMLGTGIGKSAAAAKWAPAGAPWQAIGEFALLALLLAMAVSLAFVLAQSLHRIGRISPT